MPKHTLSWSEIRNRAIAFGRRWSEELHEQPEAQTFWNEFFTVFGVRRKAVATFEEKVKGLSGSYGRIDLFWKGRFLAEHKSADQQLDKASTQAFDYIQDLINDGRQREVPRFVAVCNFHDIVLYDLEPEDQGELFGQLHIETHAFPIAELQDRKSVV